MYKLELVNKKTKEVTIFDDIVDINYGEKLFFNFEINAAQLADGEYTLSLYEDGKLIATDTLCVGDFDVVGLQYKKGEAIYIETKLEAKNQEKQTEVTDVHSTITPDEDYDAMTTVQVNAQPVYDGAYNAGNADGYSNGYNVGVNTQKEKLESIVITANGNYVKEDGYNVITVDVPDINGSYDDGYADGIEEGISNAGELIAETAQVLNITENGLYGTKYSKDEDFEREVTGYFDDGTPLYNYAYLNGKVFKTDAFVSKDSKMEVWWKPSAEWDTNSYGGGIVGTIENTNSFSLRIKNGISFAGNAFSSDSYDVIKEVNLENKWYHLSYSYDEGLFVDGEFCGKQTSDPSSRVEYGYINLTRILFTSTQANGYFGMVKIDDNIYIPTANGYINYVTKQPLEVYQDGVYDFDGKPEFEGNLIKTVNVNIIPKINIRKEGITFAYSTIRKVPEWADWDGINNMEHMFRSCVTLTTIPLIDISNVTSLAYMFYGCSNLTTIPKLDTSNVTTISNLFYNCTKLESLPPLNAGKVTNISNFFSYSNMTTLTDFGGLIGLKINWNDNYGLVKCPNLTYESCISILNNLYDFTGNGETPTSSQGKLKVHSNFLSLVGDEISIGTNKGWTITA